MSFSRATIAIVVLSSSLSVSANPGQPSAPARPAAMKDFTDVAYGYSIRIPSAWQAIQRTPQGEPPQRLALRTPNKNLLIVSIYRLPGPVAGHSEFEQIGEKHVESVVKAYMKSCGITMVLGDQKRDHSDNQSMRFWQGTSGLHAGISPAMLLSQHAIRYGSHTMVNIVYVSGNDSKEEVVAVDNIMNSLSFTSR